MKRKDSASALPEDKRKQQKKKRRQNRATTFILFLILLLGAGIMLYPTVSDWWNSMHQSRAVATYAEAVSTIDKELYDRLLAEAEAYNRGLISTGLRWQMTDEELAEYEDMLRIDDSGIMGYIQIEKIDCLLPIYHGTDDAVLQIGVGHIEGSSLPVGGAGSHCILSGHRGLPTARLFTDLDKIVEGDTFVIRTLDEVYTYEVDQIRIVLPTDLSDLRIVSGEDYCTLVTCTPYGINTHRMLVRGRRVENAKEAKEILVSADSIRIPNYVVMVAVGVPMLFLFLIALLIRYRRRPAGPSEEELFQQIDMMAREQEAEQRSEPEEPEEPEKKPWEDDSFWDT